MSLNMSWQDFTDVVKDYVVFCDGEQVEDTMDICPNCLILSRTELAELGLLHPPEEWVSARQHLEEIVADLEIHHV